jgi:hypothetical protein
MRAARALISPLAQDTVPLHDWDNLYALTRWILSQRVAHDSAAVDEGKMSAAVAADRLRVATALAQIWHAITNRVEIPPLAATPAEIEEMTARISEKSDAVAKPPQLEDGPLCPLPYFQNLCAALRHWHTRHETGVSARIIFIHRVNMEAARRRAAQQERIAA